MDDDRTNVEPSKNMVERDRNNTRATASVLLGSDMIESLKHPCLDNERATLSLVYVLVVCRRGQEKARTHTHVPFQYSRAKPPVFSVRAKHCPLCSADVLATAAAVCASTPLSTHTHIPCCLHFRCVVLMR